MIVRKNGQDESFALAPAEIEAAGARWLQAMRAGRFEDAWRATDTLEKTRRGMHGRREPHHLLWNGESLHRKRVFVRCQHGLGDSIQFARYAACLRSIASETFWSVQPALLGLFRCIPEIGDLRDAWTCEPDPAHDVEIECMELPYAFRDTSDTIPKHTPYINLDRVRSRTLFPVEAASRGQGMRVGLVWSASEWDVSRSIPISAYAALAGISAVRFFSLQQGPDAGQAHSAPIAITPLSDLTGAIIDAAAAILQMDLVITVDCMAAHLAGALGRRVWILLKSEADWRWQQCGTASPWYPTATLFRQTASGRWDQVMDCVANKLRPLAGECNAKS